MPTYSNFQNFWEIEDCRNIRCQMVIGGVKSAQITSVWQESHRDTQPHALNFMVKLESIIQPPYQWAVGRCQTTRENSTADV